MLKIFKIWLVALLLASPLHAAEINNFDILDANNTARWPEGMPFANVNDAGRADEGILARYHKDTNGSLTTGGAANAYTVAANQTFTAYYTGMRVTAKANHTNTGAATLNVDALGAQSISNAGASSIVSGRVYDFVYDGTNFQVLGEAAELPTGTKIVFFQAACPAGWTQDATQNNKAMRIVSGTGAGTGGSVDFTTAFASQTPSGTVGGTAITIAQMPAHTHTIQMNIGDDSAGVEPRAAVTPNAVTSATDSTGGGATHTHTWTGNAINLAVQYANFIVCTRN